MIYEAPNVKQEQGCDSRQWSIDEVARAAVQDKCNKFMYQSCIYQIDFSYRKIETTSMTSEEQDRQFGDK